MKWGQGLAWSAWLPGPAWRAEALNSSKPPQPHRWLQPFLFLDHPHLLQLCSPSQVMSGQADECKTAQNLLLHQLWFQGPVAILQPAGSALPVGSEGGRTRREKLPQVLFRLRANEPASPPRNRRKKQFILTNCESLQRGWPFLSKLVYHTEAYVLEQGGEGTSSQVIYASLTEGGD